MLDFQKIRNKQKFLFGLIAVPVIFGFVILFTPDAEDRLFGRNDGGAETGAYGEVDGEPVTRDQWRRASQLAGMAYGRFGDSYAEDKIPDVVVEMKLLEKYSINVSDQDVVDQLKEQIKNAGEVGDSMRQYFESMDKRAEVSYINQQAGLFSSGHTSVWLTRRC